jgi:hypothetical protein
VDADDLVGQVEDEPRPAPIVEQAGEALALPALRGRLGGARFDEQLLGERVGRVDQLDPASFEKCLLRVWTWPW